MHEDLKALKEQCEKMLALINNPQEGLITWRHAVYDRITELGNVVEDIKG